MSLAIGLVSFVLRCTVDVPAILAAFAKAIAPTRRAPAKIANEACGSNNGSAAFLSGHQLSDSLARVKTYVSSLASSRYKLLERAIFMVGDDNEVTRDLPMAANVFHFVLPLLLGVAFLAYYGADAIFSIDSIP